MTTAVKSEYLYRQFYLQPNQGVNLNLHQLTIYCDFDGPLVDVSERYYSTYQIALEHTEAFYQAQGQTLYLQPLTKEQFWQMKQERICDQEIAMRSGLQGDQIRFFLQYVRQIVNDNQLLAKDKMQPGVNWALSLLHSQGVKLVLVTLRCQQEATEILTNYGLKRLFSGIYGSQNCQIAYQNNAEVKTELLKAAIAAHGDTNACMVGDTEADIIAAQALDIPVIGLTCGIRSAGYLRQFQPDHLCTDLLSTAHYLLSLNSIKLSA